MTEVVADNFQLLESRQQTQSRGNEMANAFNGPANNGPANNRPAPNTPPQFGNGNTQYTQQPIAGMDSYGNTNNGMPNFGRDPFAGNGSSVDISDDDLPF